MLLDQFIASFDKPPRQLTLDIDPFDDPTHGQQQLTFFHGYYEQYQYLPRVITCAENDLVVMVCLLHGTAHAALGVEDDLEYVVRRLREVWPDVQIILAATAASARRRCTCSANNSTSSTPSAWHERRLKRHSDELLAGSACGNCEETGQPQRLFTAFWYRADSWPAQRWVVVKCEANAQGTNRRAVVTNRPARGPARGRLRRLRRSRREREPQQGTQDRLAGRPPQRSSLLRQPVPPLSAHRRPTCWYACAASSPIRPRRPLSRRCPPKPWPASSVAIGTTAVASAIRWAKASPARGGRG